MKKLCLVLSLATTILVFAGRPAFAAVLFSDDFTGGASTTYWSDTSVADYTTNCASFNKPFTPDDGFAGREYLATADADYGLGDFVATVDLTNNINSGFIFFGLGEGAASGYYHDPVAGFYTCLRYNAHGWGGAGPLSFLTNSSEVNYPGSYDAPQTIRAQLIWDSLISTATYRIDADLDGTYEFTHSTTNENLSLAGNNSRIFFGGAEVVTADNFSISDQLPELPVDSQIILDPNSGKYYELTTSPPLNCLKAKQFAESRTFDGIQGKLVQIDNASENQFAAACAGRLGSNVWCGLTDSEDHGTTEGNWVWASSTGTTPLSPTGYANWSAGEPDNGAGEGEDYVKVDSSGQWSDTRTSAGYALVEFGDDQQVARGFYNRAVSSSLGITNTLNSNQAMKVINGINSIPSTEATSQTATINFVDPDAPDYIEKEFHGETAFPNDTPGVDDDNFVMKSYGSIVIEEAGTYSIGGFHDNLVQVVVDRGSQPAANVNVSGWFVDTTAWGPGAAAVTFNAPGTYNLYCLYGENGGNGNVELAMAKGDYSTSYEASDEENELAFEGFVANAALIGDTYHGGIATTNLRQIHTQSGFMVNGNSATTLNVGTGSQSAAGNFGGDTTIAAGTAVTANTQIVVDENSEGWWSLGVGQSQAGSLTLTKNGQPVAFSQVNGTSNGLAIAGNGAMQWDAVTSGYSANAIGAVYLEAGTYDLAVDYNSTGQAMQTPIPPQLYVDGDFTVINATSTSMSPTDIFNAYELMEDAYANGSSGVYVDDYVLGTYSTIDFEENGTAGVGHIGGDVVFPIDDQTNAYATLVVADIEVTEENAGLWSFCVNSDDGFAMIITDDLGVEQAFDEYANVTSEATDTQFIFNGGRAPSDSFATIDLEAGTYTMKLYHYDREMGSALELTYAQGEHLTYDNELFHLLGIELENPEGLELYAAAGIHSEFDIAFDLLGNPLGFEDQSPYIETKIPGDANGDGKVDGSDVTILANHWQHGVNDSDPDATWSMGDFNGDGKVDGSDVTILANHWQEGVTTSSACVPEPSIIILLFITLASFLVLRQR